MYQFFFCILDTFLNDILIPVSFVYISKWNMDSYIPSILYNLQRDYSMWCAVVYTSQNIIYVKDVYQYFVF